MDTTEPPNLRGIAAAQRLVLFLIGGERVLWAFPLGYAAAWRNAAHAPLDQNALKARLAYLQVESFLPAMNENLPAGASVT